MQSHYYAEYDVIEESHWWFRARRAILAAVLDQAGLMGKGLEALDVGSGTGRMIAFLREGMGRVVGLDRDEDAVRFAARRAPAGIIRASALDLPVRDGSFDVVTAFDLIEHLPDDRRALAELGRALRPGGHLVVTVPALRMLWGDHDVLNEHLRRYRRSELERALEAAGFEVVRASYFNALLLPPIAAVRLALRLFAALGGASRKDEQGRLRSDFSMLPSPLAGAACERVMSLERHLLRAADLPLGVSIVAIARKP